jgi:hypothetical protein
VGADEAPAPDTVVMTWITFDVISRASGNVYDYDRASISLWASKASPLNDDIMSLLRSLF